MKEEPLMLDEGKDKKIAKSSSLAIGRAFYGDGFDGWMRVGVLAKHLPAFKELYYKMKIEEPKTTTRETLRVFNESIAPDKFYPYSAQVQIWTKKWNADILMQMGMKDGEVTAKKDVYQVLKTRNVDNELAYGIPDDNSMEGAVRTLGGELVNDAMQMLREDQAMEEIYDTDELMKRRNYVVNVFAHTTRMVQGKAMILLKASKEKRESAGFLMDLLHRASSGKMTDEELSFLKSTTPPVVVATENVPA